MKNETKPSRWRNVAKLLSLGSVALGAATGVYKMITGPTPLIEGVNMWLWPGASLHLSLGRVIW